MRVYTRLSTSRLWFLILSLLLFNSAFSLACDFDGDGFNSTNSTCLGNDCDDYNASINPNASEILTNYDDDDCDGWINTTSFSVKSERPRLLLTADRLANIQKNYENDSEFWQGFDQVVQTGMSGNSNDYYTPTLAVASAYYENDSYCEKAISQVVNDLPAMPGSCEMRGSDSYNLAIVYDLCYDNLSEPDKITLINWMESAGDTILENGCYATHVIQNYGVQRMYALTPIGITLFGDSNNATTYITQSLDFMNNSVNPFLDDLLADGFFPCSQEYGPGSAIRIMKTFDNINTGLGIDYITGNRYFQNALDWELHKKFMNPGNPDPSDKGYLRDLAFGSTFTPLPNGDEHMMAITLLSVEYFPMLSHYFPEVGEYFSDFLARNPTFIHNSYDDGGYYTRNQVASNVLFFNPTSQQSPIEGIGLSKSSSRLGYTVMRSDWEPDPTYIMFKSGPWITDKNHLDQNSFQILTEGVDLVPYGGAYSGSDSSYNQREYAIRTIAHNSIVVYDDTEDSTVNDGNGLGVNRAWHNLAGENYYYNEGGQRDFMFSGNNIKWIHTLSDYYTYQEVWDSGKTVKFESDDENYTYVVGDATNAYYNPDTDYNKLPLYLREFVYLRPGNDGSEFVVIFDKVKTNRSDLVKKWVIHSVDQPMISNLSVASFEVGNSSAGISNQNATGFRLDYYNASLKVNTLLPKSTNYRLIGGEGYQCWLDDSNENQCAATGNFGSWRIEISPNDLQLYDNFLHVMEISDSSDSSNLDSQLLNSSEGNMIGSLINDSWVVMFSKYDSQINTTQFNLSTTNTIKNLIMDLYPNITYYVYENSILLNTINSSPQGTILYSTNPTGTESYLVTKDANVTIFHNADTNQDGSINSTEIRAYVTDWKFGFVSINELEGAISFWKQNI